MDTLDFIDLLKKRTNYRTISESEALRAAVDELTWLFADLALGCTFGESSRAAILLDCTDALSSSTWRNILYAIRSIFTCTRETESDPLPQKCKNLRWVLSGTRDVMGAYRFMSGAATPFSPLTWLDISCFSEEEVKRLARLSFADDADRLGASIYKRTQGFRRLSQRFLHEALWLLNSEGTLPDIDQVEVRVMNHDDPNWRQLTDLVVTDEKAKKAVELLCNGGTVLDIENDQTEAFLTTGLFLKKEHLITFGNPYYRKMMRRRWRTKRRGSGLTGDNRIILDQIRERMNGHASETMTREGRIMYTKKILFLFSCPKDANRLRVDEEERVVRECLERAQLRERITWSSRHAVRVDDLRRAILDEKPDIVHFSGHGTGGTVVLENEQGNSYLVSIDALGRYLSNKDLECVVLNACTTQALGHAIGGVVTISMPNPISDHAAIEFTRGFYDQIGTGGTLREAFEEGCSNVDLKGLGNSFLAEYLEP